MTDPVDSGEPTDPPGCDASPRAAGATLMLRRLGDSRPMLPPQAPTAATRLRSAPRRTPTGDRPRRTPQRPRPTLLYLLTHAHRTRYKVGYSAVLPQRLARLEPERLDPTACWAIELPDRSTAERVERSLHRYLAPFRLRDLAQRDGST